MSARKNLRCLVCTQTSRTNQPGKALLVLVRSSSAVRVVAVVAAVVVVAAVAVVAVVVVVVSTGAGQSQTLRQLLVAQV